ncbi:MAG: site-specific recombinase, phage integrase family [Acidobacteriaceae bacterium]|nr:site-specific recombinase, phage integrase family [Acidobacteriaceae bacterium]
MWRGDIPTQRNPMELVAIEGVSKRRRVPRSLTVEELQRFVQHLMGPFRMAALLCVSFGLRISECLALRWSDDIDWLEGKLSVQRGIVRQRVGDVKTAYSQKQMSINPAMFEELKVWKQATHFSGPADWIFASPLKLGRQPWCYDQVLREFGKAGIAAGIGKIGTHSMRHTYRSWLDAVGTPIPVQQKLMRHADIRTTMNIYGDVVTNEMADAHSKVVGLALNPAQSN